MLRSYFFLLKQNDFQKAILEPIVDTKMILKIRGLGIIPNLKIKNIMIYIWSGMYQSFTLISVWMSDLNLQTWMVFNNSKGIN